MLVDRPDLHGCHVLVVEDDYYIADDIVQAFQRCGAQVIGPAPTVERGLQLAMTAGRLDGAVLDINLRDEMVFPIADALRNRRVPFVFATGYDRSFIPEQYRNVKRCEKPVDPLRIARALFP
jgi:CheY-like chemotaxis protein